MTQLELNFKKKQRHIAWVCVGTSALEAVPTWFYAFRTYAKASEFTDKACAKTHGMMWEIYPCELEEPDEALANFEVCIKAIEVAYVFDPSRKPTAEEWMSNCNLAEPRSLDMVDNFINKLKAEVSK